MATAVLLTTAVHGIAILTLSRSASLRESQAAERGATQLSIVRLGSPARERPELDASSDGQSRQLAPAPVIPGAAFPLLQGRSSTAPIAPPADRVSRLTSALRDSLLGCGLVGGRFADLDLRERCGDDLGRRLASAPRLDGLPPDKRAAYEAVAWEQDEHRAFFHLPTASTAFPHGAGGIASGPASTEIFAHNVGDPSPPKDPLLLRESWSLGPPVP